MLSIFTLKNNTKPLTSSTSLFFWLRPLYENEDDFKEIEKGKLKRENIGMPSVFAFQATARHSRREMKRVTALEVGHSLHSLLS